MALGRFRVFLTVAFVTLAARAGAARLATRLVWNDTASVPRGLYLRRPDRAIALGSTVILPVPTRAQPLVTERRYLPRGVDLMKVVVALPGDRVCLDGSDYRVNGRHLAFVRDVDSHSRPLEPYRFCGDVLAGQAFVATSAPLSFDSRYFGPVLVATLTVVTPLWTYSR